MTKRALVERVQAELIRLTNLFGRMDAEPIVLDGLAISSSSAHCLLAIDRMEPVASRDLAAELGLTKGAVSQRIAILESLALVTRDRVPGDEREKPVSLTAKGRRITAAHQARIEKILARMEELVASQGLGESEKFVGYLSQIREAIEGFGNSARDS
jgi:DNA-binding MarR family transcriptional regulator